MADTQPYYEYEYSCYDPVSMIMFRDSHVHTFSKDILRLREDADEKPEESSNAPWSFIRILRSIFSTCQRSNHQKRRE